MLSAPPQTTTVKKPLGLLQIARTTQRPSRVDGSAVRAHSRATSLMNHAASPSLSSNPHSRRAPGRRTAAPRAPQCATCPAPASGRFLRTPAHELLARAPRQRAASSCPAKPAYAARTLQPFRSRCLHSGHCSLCLPRASLTHHAKSCGPNVCRYGETPRPTTGRQQSTAQGRRPARTGNSDCWYSKKMKIRAIRKACSTAQTHEGTFRKVPPDQRICSLQRCPGPRSMRI